MPRTKKAPTSPKPGSTATSRPEETPKGSGPSVAPAPVERVTVPLATVDADAIYRKRGLMPKAEPGR